MSTQMTRAHDTRTCSTPQRHCRSARPQGIPGSSYSIGTFPIFATAPPPSPRAVPALFSDVACPAFRPPSEALPRHGRLAVNGSLSQAPAQSPGAQPPRPSSGAPARHASRGARMWPSRIDCRSGVVSVASWRSASWFHDVWRELGYPHWTIIPRRRCKKAH